MLYKIYFDTDKQEIMKHKFCLTFFSNYTFYQIIFNFMLGYFS